ncbi:putative cation transport ATPase (P-type) (TC 3.A.3) family, type IV subfamily protein [Lyophyllum shimeji]|uniref:Phospholipid-transporting ATPase n=1 Tax=Lyophyllum shimeji TaxID=47721 RepID=A0A9P3UIR8_LYOSH|nr:putative cation transport ATPase (P-type) (TC 3.A.3) family, type IV subfamily protein [Lyophyllum shimeji]
MSTTKKADTKPARSWFARAAAFKVESLFSRKREPGPPRTILVNESVPAHYLDHKGRPKPEHVYTSNQIITSKYTVITFLPRNLLEQFRRVANLYFLGISILQFFPKFSTISPGVVILPLIFIILVTALKDGYEDVKRHEADRHVNHSSVKVLTGGEWKNSNAMEPKSKTFVRGLARPRRRAPKPKSSGARDEDSDSEFEDASQAVLDEKVKLAKPRWNRIMWEDLKVGDFVKIMNNEPIPADIMICATSEEEDVAFVETKNLDGETNLKSRHAVASLSHLRDAASCADRQNSFRINCDRPDTNMYRLQANVQANGDTSPVDMSMTLLRGTVLRNTRWAIGVVLFTGLDTKIVMNSGSTPSKRSKVERQMDPQVVINLIILAIMAVCCAIADSLLQVKYFPLGAPWLYGADLSDDNPRINGLITWAFSLLTFQTIVPISLYVSIEFVRTVQAAFIYLDGDIWYEKTQQATVCRSWNLSDDLGQIEYIFSDKTGTLTQNSMVFRQCSIGGRAYRGDSDVADAEDSMKSIKPPSISNETGDKPHTVNPLGPAQDIAKTASKHVKDASPRFRDAYLTQDIEDAVNADPDSENAPHSRLLNGFFTVLALCHTVLTSVDPVTGEIEYKAQSPDEAALVQAAADVGFVFCGRDKETLLLRTPSSPEVEKYELLNILEFTSARKRMSVVLRKLGGEDERLFLLTKGADNVIFQRLRESERDLMAETEAHLSEFANNGLRTLTLAYKVIAEDDYRAWSERYHEASIALEGREEKMEAVCNELEQDLRLLGATAIEDRLQDGVPETIADLKRAGIRIWVATGDKLETAIAIGRSTNLIANDSNIIIIRGGNEGRTVYQQMLHAIDKFFPDSGLGAGDLPRPSTSSRDHNIPLQRINSGVSSVVGSQNGDLPGGFVLVIDGAALLDAFEDEENKGLLLRLATMCEGVICCRVSPLQKALIVRLVKDGLGVMTLAIGDGANDVSMIQAADVGVGISGEEGLQAVNSSDYAIAQFRFLKKLLLVHGHWSYARNGTMILNFFYKNVVPVGVLWWFQIYDGWSAHFVFEYIYILFWNSIWTIAPVIGIGLFDRVLDYHILMDVPELYHYGRRGTWFGLRSFFVYLLDGLYQSVIIFFLILYAYFPSTTSRWDGYAINLQEFSTTMAVVSVMVANIFTGFSATAWNAWVFFAVFIGIIIVWLFTIIYSLISPGYAVTSLYGNYYLLFTSAYFWLCMPITFFLSLAPRLLAKAWKFGFAPDDLDTMRWVSKYEPDRDLSRDAHLSQLKAMRRSPSSASRRTSRSRFNESATSLDMRTSLDRRRRSVDVRLGSRTDMATGLVSVDRGFDFTTEENGVAMRRMQTNLSERRLSSRNLAPPSRPTSRKGKEALSHVFSLRRGLRKKLSSSRKSE